MSTPGPTHPQHGADTGDPGAELARLRALLDEAARLISRLEGHALLADQPGEDPARVADLEQRLVAARADQEELMSQLVEAERQAGKLTSLYVATYQLHVSLDPTEVQSAIAEITRDLLGAEAFVLLIKDEIDGGCEVALHQGHVESGRFAGTHYEGGDPVVDATLADGVLRLDGEDGSEALAAVPLRVEEDIVGALVILKTFDHKTSPLAEDRDILDLMAAHAASALFAARVYSKTDRKLRTLESLVNLIRGA